MTDKIPIAAAADSEFLSMKLLEKPAPGGEILPALLSLRMETAMVEGVSPATVQEIAAGTAASTENGLTADGSDEPLAPTQYLFASETRLTRWAERHRRRC
jgi:hypothetical protein